MSKHVLYEFSLSSATSTHARLWMRVVCVLDGRENATGFTGKISAEVSSYELLENMVKSSSQKVTGSKTGRSFVPEVTGKK